VVYTYDNARSHENRARSDLTAQNQ
jgi:hypothetical protein